MIRPRAVILVVDDSPIVLEIVREALEARDLIVETLENPLECEAMLARLRPDVLVLDIAMPQLDGLSLLRLIRGRRVHDCQVLLYSDRTLAELMAVVRASGADGGAIKTPDCGELIEVLESVLARRRLDGSGTGTRT